MRSFDGTPLDTDVTIPAAPASATRPLMIFMHGWGNSKTDWESTTLQGDGGGQYHWNNAWFASQGYVVLNYTARGFHKSCGKDARGTSMPPTRRAATHRVRRAGPTLPTGAGRSTTPSTSLGFSSTPDWPTPSHIVASGGSYGGGQSWDLAL